MKKIVEDLKKHIEDYGSLDHLWVYNKSLYCRLTAAASTHDLSVEQFARQLGFEYDSEKAMKGRNDRKIIEASWRIVTDLQNYVNRYGNLEDLNINDRNLYFRVFHHARKDEMSIGEFVNSIGFNYPARSSKKTTIHLINNKFTAPRAYACEEASR